MGTTTVCDKCGYDWEYGGESDNYCTCPRCKGSVKVGNEMTPEEKREAEEESDYETDRPPVPEVVLETGGIQREVPVTDAVKEVHEQVAEVGGAQEEQRQRVDRAEADIGEVVSEIQQVRREVREVARYLKGVVEEMGGEVEYDEVRLGGPNIPEALEGEGRTMDNLQQRVNAAAEEVRRGEKSVEEALSEMDEEGGPYDPTEEFDR